MHVLSLFWRNYRKEVVRRVRAITPTVLPMLSIFVSSLRASSMGALAVRWVFNSAVVKLCANSKFYLITSNGDLRRWRAPSLDFGLGQTLCSNRSCQKARDRCDTHTHTHTGTWRMRASCGLACSSTIFFVEFFKVWQCWPCNSGWI